MDFVRDFSPRYPVLTRVIFLVFLLLLLCTLGIAHAGQMAPMAPPPGPTVWLTITPNSSPSYVAPASVNVSVEAYDNSGYDITQIKLYKNNVLVTTAPGGFLDTTLNSLAAGSYTIRATATSESGGTGSKSQTFTVSVPTNQAPTVSLAADGANYVAPATINLTATAADSDGTVSKVEFYNGGTLIGTDTSAPYTMSWTGVGGGSYSLTARATDNASAVTTSSAVSVMINSSVITGNIDGVVNSSTIRGWACSTYRNDSIAVHLYLGGAYGTGTFIGAYNANLASEAGIANTCSASGTNYRFEIPLTEAMREQYAGQGIYVHGISPIGGSNNLISQSGAFTVPPPPRASAFVSQSVPSTMVIGQPYAVSVQMKNTGTATWSAADNYRLGSQNPHDNTNWGSNRIGLGANAAPGQTATFNATITAPATPGTYNFQWRMLQEGTAWFGATTSNVAVTVTPPPPPPPPATTSSKTEVIEYHDDLSKWVLGQQKKLTVNNIVVSETTFNANAQPETVKSFGKLQQTLTYYADGTVATVKDGNNNVTTLSNWYRGVPKNIQYADGTTESATVNDNGWITSVTDENGYATGYGYDAMGRLSSIVYPTDDNVPWNTTTRVFGPVATAMLGLPAGHWRQSISTGNARQYIYYDALWRPVLEESYDATDYANTLSQVVKRYDSEGRLVFQSYPTRGVADFNQSLPGTWTAYDALGRVTSVSQDSEQGLLVTLTEYLPGFQTRTTNPRNNSTTTSYQTFDQPSYEAPVVISHPETAVTEIYRDVFGKPTSIVRRNTENSLRVERKYYYNANQLLCRTDEPETGSTVMDYDGAGNLVWSVNAGLNLGSPYDCQHVNAWNTGRVIHRGYDARNRLTNLYFPDGRGNQRWFYTPDGLPSQITTYNDLNNGAEVVNNYYYNKRRLLISEASQQPGWYTWWLGYGYTVDGHLGGQSYPTGLTVSYYPNALGQPTKVVDTLGQTYASGISYHPNGSIKQFTYGNGITHAMSQNARQLPRIVTDSSANGQNVSGGEYTYDANGNVTNYWDYPAGAAKSKIMTYDGLDRLTSASSPMFGGDGVHRFGYDVLDNLKSWKLAGVKDYADYVYDAGNRLVNIKNSANATVVGLGYDVQGNLQNKNGQAYLFDYGNRLRETPGKEWYRYDGQGRRVLTWRHTEPGVVSIYSQSGQLLYDENYRASGRKASDYVYLAGSLLATRSRNIDTNAWTLSFQHTDALGSPVAVTDAAGAVIDRTDYEPYGATINKPNYDGIGFTGHVQDGATGLTYMQQRYYDPMLGVFDSVDPVTAYSSPVTNFCRYCYGRNNPYKFTDPDGRQSRENDVPSTGIPLADWIMTPSVDRGSHSQMVKEQLTFELSQPRSFKQIVSYIAVAMSLGTGAAGGALRAEGLAGVARVGASEGAAATSTRIMTNPKNLIPTQTRAEISGSQVKRMASDMKVNGYDQSHPVDAVRNERGRLEIVDGHHRTEAAKRAGIDKIPVDVWEKSNK